MVFFCHLLWSGFVSSEKVLVEKLLLRQSLRKVACRETTSIRKVFCSRHLCVSEVTISKNFEFDDINSAVSSSEWNSVTCYLLCLCTSAMTLLSHHSKVLKVNHSIICVATWWRGCWFWKCFSFLYMISSLLFDLKTQHSPGLSMIRQFNWFQLRLEEILLQFSHELKVNWLILQNVKSVFSAARSCPAVSAVHDVSCPNAPWEL